MSLPCRSFVDGSWIWKKNSSSSRNEITSGSKTISTASAWSPWLRYVALGVLPPEYPTRLESTPGRLRSSSCAPQKQPPARIAVSVVTCASLLSSTTGEHRDPGWCFLLGAQCDELPEPRWNYGRPARLPGARDSWAHRVSWPTGGGGCRRSSVRRSRRRRHACRGRPPARGHRGHRGPRVRRSG